MFNLSKERDRIRQATADWKKKGWVEQAYWGLKLGALFASVFYVISGAVLMMNLLLLLLKMTGPIDTTYVNYVICVVIVFQFIEFMANWALKVGSRIDPFKQRPGV